MTHAIKYLERYLKISSRLVKEAKGSILSRPKSLNVEQLKRDIENLRGWADELKKYSTELDSVAQRLEDEINSGQFNVNTLDNELKTIRNIVTGKIK
ncbi:MAG: hypothetical protein ACMXYG_07380 [Candidatus Woesearchaeota archaeon]